jgi:hypothetical protein
VVGQYGQKAPPKRPIRVIFAANKPGHILEHGASKERHFKTFISFTSKMKCPSFALLIAAGLLAVASSEVCIHDHVGVSLWHRCVFFSYQPTPCNPIFEQNSCIKRKTLTMK